jgi:hypothetical protein
MNAAVTIMQAVDWTRFNLEGGISIWGLDEYRIWYMWKKYQSNRCSNG